MEINEYQKSAMSTLNPMLDKKDVLINSVMGLCGESGEAIDIVKKWLMQGHELDKEHLIKELGDVAWYLAEAATALDVPLEPSCAAISISCKNATRMALIRRRPFNAGKGIPNARFECISYASLKQRTFICGTEIRCWRYCAKKAPFDLSDCKEMRP